MPKNNFAQMHRLRYKKPIEDRQYAPGTDTAWYVDRRVPEVPHHRVVHLHTLNVILEETAPGELAAVWDEIGSMLRNFVRTYPRHALEDEHRQILWVLYARILSRRPRTDPDYTRLRELDLHLRHTQHTVKTLWHALHLLRNAWKSIPFFRGLRTYVMYLAARCGDFFWEASVTRGPFDFEMYTEQRDGLWRVTESFFKETERVFYFLLRDLDLREAFEDRPPIDAIAADTREAVYTWVRSALDTTAIRTFVEQSFRKIFLARRVFDADTERFEERERFETSEPYHIIAKRSVREHDTLLSISDTPTVIEDMLRIEKTGTVFDPAHPDEPASDRSPVFDLALAADARDVTILCAAAMLDSAFSGADIRFRDFFVSEETLPTEQDYPVILSSFHEYHVCYRGQVMFCPDAISAIYYWVVCMGDNSSAVVAVARIAPNAQTFYDAYRACTGRQACAHEEEDAERVRQESLSGTTLRMPTHYS